MTEDFELTLLLRNAKRVLDGFAKNHNADRTLRELSPTGAHRIQTGIVKSLGDLLKIFEDEFGDDCYRLGPMTLNQCARLEQDKW